MQDRLFCHIMSEALLQLSAAVPFNFINLANAYHSFSWHQFSLCYKSCLPWRSACYILNAMVKEISGELLFILTVLQQLSTWQECHNQSACYLFLTITWLPSSWSLRQLIIGKEMCMVF